MKFCAVVANLQELHDLAQAGVSEVLLHWAPLSRWPELHTQEELLDLAKAARALQLRVVLVWDMLPSEERFQKLELILAGFPWHYFDAVRCQDYGVLLYLRDHTSGVAIQWIAEVAHQNINALQTIEAALPGRLDRLCLNLETPVATIAEYAQKLHTPLELLGAGPLLLFYTPRSLLSAAFERAPDEKMECLGSSEETPHRDFLLRQHHNGTLMYHPKDFFILDKIEDAKAAGPQWLRLDGRAFKGQSWPAKELAALIREQNNQSGENVRTHYPRAVIRGYFHHNRSDKLFVHLKNQRLQGRHESMVGSIVDVIKKNCMTLRLDRAGVMLKVGDHLALTTPDGKHRSMCIHKMRNPLGEDIQTAQSGDCVVLEHLSGVCVKTQVSLTLM